MMKTVFQRSLICLLALLLCLSAIACAGTQEGPAGTGETGGDITTVPGDSGSDTPSTEDGRFPVVKDGSAVSVVYPMNDMDAMGYAQGIANKIKSLTGVAAEFREDSRKLGEEPDTDSYEIFIGTVDNPICTEAMKRVPYGGAAVLVEGHKLCALSMDPDLLSSAVLKLLATLTNACDKSAKTILVAADLYIAIEGTDLIKMIPEFDGKTPTGTYESTANASLTLFENVTEAEMDAYQQKVLSAGYSLYSGDTTTGKAEDAKNRFLTFRRDSYILTLLYTPSDRILRAVIEWQKDSALGWRAEDNLTPVEKVCDVTLTQAGLLYDAGYMNGMCYVMRLEDGSFIVMDGGHSLQKNADRLYQILRKQAPDPDHIVIAAWIFSHSHGDHVGAFPYFTASYADRVKVERFIFNFPSAAQFDGDSTASGNSTVLDYVARYKDAVVTNAHPGQVMVLHGAKIRILYTADLFLPAKITYGNTASMCWTIEVAGVKTMMMGDVGAEVAGVMERIYSNEVFRSDVLQVAHHGIGSSPNSLYPRIDPTWVMFPLGTGPLSKWEHADDCIEFVNAAHNRYFFTSEKCKDHIFVANDDILILTYRNGEITDHQIFENDVAYLSSNIE